MMVFGRKRVLVICTIFMSIGALILLGEVSVRLFVKNGDVTPDVLRNRSVQYEPAMFCQACVQTGSTNDQACLW